MYTINLKQSAEKELDSIPAKDRARIITALREFKDNPRPLGCEKLTARMDYRVRRGNYRILYVIDERRKAVEVISVGNRKDVYKRLK